jgi:spermidine synthase
VEYLTQLFGVAFIERVEIVLDDGFDGGKVVTHEDVPGL